MIGVFEYKNDPQGQEVNMRLILSRILLAAGAVSLTVSIVFAVNVGWSYQRAVVKGDFAGFSLGMHVLLYILAPLTLSLLLAACLLDPPAWLLGRLGISTSTSQSSRSILSTVVVVLCLASAAVIFLGAAYFVGANLVRAVRHYSYGYRGLVVIFLQNLAFSFPLLTLGALLAWAGWALRKLRSRTRDFSHREA
jgi:hypothetical protein